MWAACPCAYVSYLSFGRTTYDRRTLMYGVRDTVNQTVYDGSKKDRIADCGSARHVNLNVAD